MSRGHYKARKKYYKKQSIFKRDGTFCRNCGSTENLTLHHIIPKAMNGSDSPRNLILLCRECHILEHSRAGKAESVRREGLSDLRPLAKMERSNVLPAPDSLREIKRND